MPTTTDVSNNLSKERGGGSVVADWVTVAGSHSSTKSANGSGSVEVVEVIVVTGASEVELDVVVVWVVVAVAELWVATVLHGLVEGEVGSSLIVLEDVKEVPLLVDEVDVDTCVLIAMELTWIRGEPASPVQASLPILN